MADTYKCAACGGIYQKGWTDEEADAEAEENYGPGIKAVDTSTVCDRCFKIMRKWEAQQSLN